MLFRAFIIILTLSSSIISFAADSNEAKMEAERAQTAADSLFAIYEYPEAIKNYYVVLNYKTEAGDTLGAEKIRLQLAEIAYFEGYLSQCLKHLEKCQPVFEKYGENLLLFRSLKMKGEIFSKRANYESAIASYKRASEVGEAMGNPHLKFVGIESLGKLSLMRKRFEGAMANFDRALEAAPDNADSALAYSGIASVLAKQENYDKALAFSKVAEDVAKGDTTALIEIYGTRADIYVIKNEYLGALKYYAMQLDMIKIQSDELSKARIMMNIAMIHEIRREFAKAADFMQEVVIIYERINSSETVRANEYLQMLRGEREKSKK